MSPDKYMYMLAHVTSLTPSVVIHYPEQLHSLSVAFYGVSPDFRRVKQPYKNPTDKRIQKRIAEGKGARLYDWWEVNQVKNVAKCKTAHPCQMPLEVMKRVIGVLPDGIGVIEPYAGSGTTLVACKELGIPFIGYEIVPEYAEIAKARLADSEGRES